MTATEATAADLARFVHPEQVTELRALHVGQKGRTFSGWFDGRHLFDMARHALALGRQAAGVYFVPNPVNPELAAKRMNTVLNVPRGFGLTHDADVLERRFLIVDLDPHRFTADAGQECPSAARELALARRIARGFVCPFLADVGFGRPLVMCSGNGIHLVYQTRPTPGRECGGADPIATVLRLVAERYSCVGVAIDTNTFNPCRMLKVPGTMTRKGEPTRDRPHRPARILEVPDGWREPHPAPAAPAAAGRERDPEPDQARVERGRRKPAARPAPDAVLFDRGSSGPPVH